MMVRVTSVGVVVGLMVACGCSGKSENRPVGNRMAGASPTNAFSPPIPPGWKIGDVGVSSGALPEKASLADYLAYAALNNASLRAAFHRARAAAERVPQVSALPDPRFTYRYYIEEVETRVGAQRQSFQIAQTFPWFGKLALRGEAAADAAREDWERFQVRKLQLFNEVKQAYYEYYYLGRAVTITDENLRLMEYIETVARAQYKTAAAAHADVIRAQVELGRIADHLEGLKDLRTPIVALLNAALNRPPAAPLPDYPADLPDPSVAADDEQLLARMNEWNPQLKQLDAEIARRSRIVELAKKEYFPDVTIGGTWIDTSNSTSGRHPPDDGKDPLVAMVSVNLPIWWDKLSAGVREARNRRVAVRHRKVELANSLGAKVKMAAYRYRDAERQFRLYRDTLSPKAQEAYDATVAGYRAGKITFGELVDAERLLLEFQLTEERARADRAQHLAVLEMLTGGELPPAKPAGKAD